MNEILFKVLENKWLLVKSNKSSVKIPSYDKDKFPEINFSLEEDVFSLKAKELDEVFKKMMDFVSDEPIKINLQGIFIQASEENLDYFFRFL